MRIIHRVGMFDRSEIRDHLRELGIAFNGPSSDLSRRLWFDIEEAHPNWPALRKWLEELGEITDARTVFSPAELDSAKYVALASFPCGYPQPALDGSYIQRTHDVTDYCANCGMGAVQNAPFLIKGEPKWGKRTIFELTWVHDEFFVPPEVWESVFRPFGIGFWPVLHWRTEKELQTVVQLKLCEFVPGPLAMPPELRFEVCDICDRKKYLPIERGCYPPFTVEPTMPICRTQETFGSGASAWNAIAISNEVYRAIRDRKIGRLFLNVFAASAETRLPAS